MRRRARLLTLVACCGATPFFGELARADDATRLASTGPQQQASAPSTLLAPSASEAAQWQRLRSVQALIPSDSRRELPFASMQIGAGPGAVVTQANRIGGSFRVHDLTYLLDGRELSQEKRSRVLEGESSFTVFEGRMLPGTHELRVEATIRGHGYGVFSYMKAYRVKLRGGKRFEVRPGQTTRVRIALDEDASAPLQNRFSFGFQVERELSARAPQAAKPAPPALEGLAPL